ncbi:mucin-17 isoform X1 [Brachionus plicatilis]|uniref:Mucin-17 isoform X1 n=1 Tax=Brachionus plicatilis TaxID=10195 RepID=A0A3M7SRD8_BRAPC|nr:mucin-17 isoform X1 [Brachionus plicatilis]
MNVQQSTQQSVQTGQPIYLSSDSSQKSHIIQMSNQSQNMLYTSPQLVQSNSNGYYLIQQPQQSSSQAPTPSTSSPQPKPLTTNPQPIIIQNQKIQQNSPRIIIQQPSSGQVVLPQQHSQSGPIFLNINNRIVPVQSMNIKQNTPTPGHNQSSPQFVILSNPSANSGQSASLAGDITEKMKQLEQIQSQLKQYQQKILHYTSQGQQQQQQTTVVTQAQIQAVLSNDEQLQLQKLIATKKSVEGEIQQLKQKLMSQDSGGQAQAQSKLQLLQQVTQKLSALRASKTVTVDAGTGQQQLVLTHEEFDQMKKLIDLQSSLQNELKSEAKPSNQSPQPQITTTINLNELNLNEKLKLNDLIKNQIEQVKQNMSSQTNKDVLPQLKEKYILLIKKQAELQSLIDKEKEAGARQTPVKIRNVIGQGQMIKSQVATPLRTLVINNKDNTATSSVNASPSLPTGPVISLQQAIALKKQNFAHLELKCLNFEELAQNGVISRESGELTVNLLRQLDERISQVINREQLESFQKNQVKLVRKYLEQQHLAKQNIKNSINEQLVKDQKLAAEPDFKTPFNDRTDAIKRLSRYHVFQKTYFEPSHEDSKKFDECFEQVSDRLLRIADAMKKRFNLLQLRSMQKEVSSSEETLLLKLYVDDLKQDLDNAKQEIKDKNEEQKHQIQSKPLVQVIKSDSPQTIRNLIKMNQTCSESNSSSFGLKRVLKSEDEEKSPKLLKTDSVSFIGTEKSESNTSLNQLSSSAYPSSSSSSFNAKLEPKQTNADFDETFTNTNFDDFDNEDSDDSNDYDQYETFRPLNSNQNVLDINEENSSSGLNTLANFDDFIINEDDLPMSSILDF